MEAPSGEVREAIQRVAGRPEGMVIQKYLQEQSEKMRDRLTYEQQEVNLRQFQGEARVLDVFLKAWKP